MQISIIESSGSIAPLYHRYPQQSHAQPAFIQLNSDGHVFADWSGEIGNAVPVNVWNGTDVRVIIPNTIRRDELINIMSSDCFKELVEQYYSDSPEGVVCKISGLFYDARTVDVIDAGDVVAYVTKNEYLERGSLGDLVESIYEEAKDEGYIIEGDIERELQWKFEEGK